VLHSSDIVSSYVLMEDVLPLEASLWVGEAVGRTVDQLDCQFEGAVRADDVFLPVIRVNGLVYHHTPTTDRANSIMQTGFSLAHRLNGRAFGDGVYACRTEEAARAWGKGAILQIGLFDVILLDSSAGNAYARLAPLRQYGASLESVLATAGIQGVLCSWGVVIYDPPAAVPLGHIAVGSS